MLLPNKSLFVLVCYYFSSLFHSLIYFVLHCVTLCVVAELDEGFDSEIAVDDNHILAVNIIKKTILFFLSYLTNKKYFYLFSLLVVNWQHALCRVKLLLQSCCKLKLNQNHIHYLQHCFKHHSILNNNTNRTGNVSNVSGGKDGNLYVANKADRIYFLKHK